MAALAVAVIMSGCGRAGASGGSESAPPASPFSASGSYSSIQMSTVDSPKSTAQLSEAEKRKKLEARFRELGIPIDPAPDSPVK